LIDAARPDRGAIDLLERNEIRIDSPYQVSHPLKIENLIHPGSVMDVVRQDPDRIGARAGIGGLSLQFIRTRE